MDELRVVGPDHSIPEKLSELDTADDTLCATDGPHPYLKTIFEVSGKYLKRVFNERLLNEFKTDCLSHIRGDRDATIEQFIKAYYDLVKKEYQKQYANADSALNQDIFSEPHRPKMLWGDCLDFLRRMDSESVQLMITSPPYYNARDYSQWDTLDDYLEEMCRVLSRNVIGYWIIIVLSFSMSEIYLTTTIDRPNRLGENAEYLWVHISL